MNMQEMIGRSVKDFGNPYRILKVFEKAREGKSVTYVSLGGSITQGAGASVRENCYAARIAQWWQKTFPNCEFQFVNAGIGATGSLIGVHRVQRDVLDFEPDFVTVEFAVNDTAVRNIDTAEETYSNLLHKLVFAPGAPAVLALNMTTEDNEHTQHIHYPIARHYKVPYISFADAVIPEWTRDESLKKVWLKDGVHPLDTGHKIAADLVCAYLDSLLSLSAADYQEWLPDAPYGSMLYQNAVTYKIGDIQPEDPGCFHEGQTHCAKISAGWVASENGAPLVFRFQNCRRIHVLFEKDNTGIGGKAVCDVNGVKTEMDCDFPNGYGRYAHNVLVHEAPEPGEAVLTLTPMLDAEKSFALMAILVS